MTTPRTAAGRPAGGAGLDPATRVYPANARLVLAMLLLVYIFNFLDRQILSILTEPIIGDLGLDDAQMGLLHGPAFALLYSILGIPLALLADKTSRSGVIAGALALWSGFTALCGTATSFGTLFLFRVGVGVGEAGGVAPSYALITDYFPPRKQARALAIYSFGVPVGLAGGVLLGAYIAAYVNWRAAFYFMGAAGIAIAPIFKYVVRDIPRPVDHEGSPRHRVSAVFPILLRKPAFWLMGFAAGSSSLVGYGLAAWTPSVLRRSYGLDLTQTGWFMGSLLLVGGTFGVFMGGYLADRLGSGDKRWYARLPMIAWLVCVPLFAFGLLSPSLTVAWFLLVIPNGLNILWLGPVTNAVQHLVERPMRATASASFLLINNLIGLGVGPFLIGAVSEALAGTYGVESLRYAAVFALVFYLVAAGLMALAVPRLAGGWVEESEAA